MIGTNVWDRARQIFAAHEGLNPPPTPIAKQVGGIDYDGTKRRQAIEPTSEVTFATRIAMQQPRLGYPHLGFGVGRAVFISTTFWATSRRSIGSRSSRRTLSTRKAGHARCSTASPSATPWLCTAFRYRSAAPTHSTSTTWRSSSAWPARSRRSGSRIISAGPASSGGTRMICCHCHSTKIRCGM